ncbi:EAL and HDOD domain-containing protein [Paenibacillus chartarius]|uniref:EAL and HDOD domain-containing protein n=1 Tax=Paenibacillus chartarius TaxID=747481 RepID=A0ABV6DJM1_9BACL
MRTSVIQIVNELNKDEPDYQVITEIIERDLGLSYKLLKAANSVAYGAGNKIYSIKQALVRFGIEEMKKWMYLMMLQEKQNVDNRELIKTSLIRGKFMELLSLKLGKKHRHFEFFLTGVLSSMDTLLHKDMLEVVHELPLTPDVKEALLGKDNELRQVLNFVLLLERADWQLADRQPLFNYVHKEIVMSLYLKSIKWFMKLNH